MKQQGIMRDSAYLVASSFFFFFEGGQITCNVQMDACLLLESMLELASYATCISVMTW